MGPFKPGISLSCPLWLAVNLKQRQRCRIVCPAWMEVFFATKQLLPTCCAGGEVGRGQRPGERKPYLHWTTCQPYIWGCQPGPGQCHSGQSLLWHVCIPHTFQDIEKADEVRTVLKDLWDLRQAKLRWDFKLLLYNWYDYLFLSCEGKIIFNPIFNTGSQWWASLNQGFCKLS